MKFFRRFLSVAVTLVLIVTLFSESLYASFTSPEGGSDPEVSNDSQIVESQPNTEVAGDINVEDVIIPPDDSESELPAEDQVAPTEDQTAPTDDQSAPADDQTAPTDDQSAPADDQESLSDDQTAPADDLTVTDEATDGESSDTVSDTVVEQPGADLPQSDEAVDSMVGDVLDSDSPADQLEVLAGETHVDLGKPKITVKIDDTLISPGPDISFHSGDKVTVHFDWIIPDDLKDLSNKVFEYNFPCTFFTETKNGDLKDQDGKLIGDFSLVPTGDGNVHLTVKFSEDATDVKSLWIELEANIPSDPSKNQNGDKFQEHISDQTFNFVVSDSTSDVYSYKSASSDFVLDKIANGQYKFKMTYKIETSVRGQANDVTITDTLSHPDNSELTNVTVEYTPKDSSRVNSQAQALTGASFEDKGDGVHELTIPGTLYDGDRIVITYDVIYKFNETDAKAILAGAFDLSGYSNTAKWNWAESESIPSIDHHSTVTPSVSGTNVAKTGKATYDNGKIISIDWTVTITLSKTAGNLENLKNLLGLGPEGELSAEDKQKILELFGFDVSTFKDTLGNNLDEPENWADVFKLENAVFTDGDPITVTFSYTTAVSPDYENDGSGLTNTFSYTQNGTDSSKDAVVGKDESSDVTYKKTGEWDSVNKKAHWDITITIPFSKRGQQGITIKDTPRKNNLKDGFTHRVVKSEEGIILDFYMDGAESPYDSKTLKELKELGGTATFNDDGSVEFTIPSELTKDFAKIVVHLDTEVIDGTGQVVGSGFINNGSGLLQNEANDAMGQVWLSDSQSQSDITKWRLTGGDGKLYAEWRIEITDLHKLLISVAGAESGIDFKDSIVSSPKGITMEFIKDSLKVELHKDRYNARLADGYNYGDYSSADLKLKDSDENVFAHIEDIIKEEILKTDPDNVNGTWNYSISSEKANRLLDLAYQNTKTNDSDKIFDWIDKNEEKEHPFALFIIYKTKITNLPEFYKATWESGNEQGNGVTFTNNITYNIGDEIPHDASANTSHKYDKVLNKEGTKDYDTAFKNSQYYQKLSDEADKSDLDNIKKHYEYSSINKNFFYYIDVNPYGDLLGKNIVSLGADKTRLELKDTMGKSLSLILDSLRVYEITNDEDGNIVSVTKTSDYKVKINEQDNSFTLDLPDGKRMLIVYWAKVAVNPADSLNLSDGSNRAEMDVYGYNKDDESEKFDQTEKAMGGAVTGVGDYTLQLFKVLKNSDGTVESLAGSGVEFTLYTASYENGKLKKGDPIATVSSTQNNPGMSLKIESNQNPKNSIFALEESEPPTVEGKTFKAIDPIFFIFSDNENISEYQSLIDSNQLKVYDNTGTAVIYNEEGKDNPDSPSATLQLGVRKTVKVENGTSAPEMKFTFKISGDEFVPTPNTLTVSKDTTAYFGAISFDAKKLGLTADSPSKTLTYTISETGNEAGWTYAKPKTVTVTVTLTNDNKIEVKVDGDPVSEQKAVDFENTYTYNGVTAHFEATKTVKSVDGSGNDVKNNDGKYKWNENGGDFSFKAEAVGNAPKLKKDVVTNNSNGKVVFEDITFTEASVYQYVISEEISDVTGIINTDDSKYLVTITVTENTEQGKYEASVTYAKITGEVDGQYTTDKASGSAPEFVNTYRKNENTFDFNITKKVEGDKNGKSAGNEYFFTVEQIDENGKVTSTSEKEITLSDLSKDDLATGKSVKAIDTVIVTDEDVGRVYHYRVTEKAANYPGISFDATVYDVYFTVVKNGEYPLSVTSKVFANEGTDNEAEVKEVVFTNAYTAPAEYEINLNATKSIVGRSLEDSDVFNFTLKALTPDAPMPEGAVDGKKTVSNNGSVIDFGIIKYSELDEGKTYQYEVTEDADTKVNQVTNDSSVYNVTVEVTKDAEANKMLAEVTYTKNDEAVNDMTFVNRYEEITFEKEVGNLSVSKSVAGSDAEFQRIFSFNIVLSDRTISGYYGQVYFANGTATVNLVHGQTVTAVGLPAGIGYAVYELGADGYVVTSYGTTGVIPADNTAHASFINTKDKKYGALSVTKNVEGDEGWDPEQEFMFTVTLSDSTINGVYGDMNFTGGVATLVLKDGETAVASGLPGNVTYTVTEAEVEGFSQSAVGNSGTIVANQTASAVFVNTYEAPKLGNLSVTKTVTGTAGDQTKLFGFKITLSDAEINGQYGDMFFENGFATVYLSHGMTAVATGLPEGTGYTVVELDSEDYVVSMTGESGFIIYDYTVPVSFINHKDAPENPGNPHGDDSNPGVGKDRPHGDDMNAGVGMDDMNPATGNYEAESFANGVTSIIILWTMVFLFGAVVIGRKHREDIR